MHGQNHIKFISTSLATAFYFSSYYIHYRTNPY